MAVLVTGGAVMLGLHVARAPAEQGRNVVSCSPCGAPPCPEAVLGP